VASALLLQRRDDAISAVKEVAKGPRPDLRTMGAHQRRKECKKYKNTTKIASFRISEQRCLGEQAYTLLKFNFLVASHWSIV
jgi:hypothetical protein